MMPSYVSRMKARRQGALALSQEALRAALPYLERAAANERDAQRALTLAKNAIATARAAAGFG